MIRRTLRLMSRGRNKIIFEHAYGFLVRQLAISSIYCQRSLSQCELSAFLL